MTFAPVIHINAGCTHGKLDQHWQTFFFSLVSLATKLISSTLLIIARRKVLDISIKNEDPLTLNYIISENITIHFVDMCKHMYTSSWGANSIGNKSTIENMHFIKNVLG